MLEAITKIDGTNACINLKGRGDSTSSDIVFDEFKIAEEKGCKDFEFNLTEVDYICSSTLRAFLRAQKECNKENLTMKVTGASDGVKDVFEITGYGSIMTIL